LLGVAPEALNALEEGTYTPQLEQRVSDASSVMERPPVELTPAIVSAYLANDSHANDVVIQYLRNHPEVLQNPQVRQLVSQPQRPTSNQPAVSQKSADELKKEKDEQERVKKLGRFGFIEMD
jgi:predicted transcriptional regulator